MPKPTHNYLGPSLPGDIIRMILMHATHSGATVRVVCKAWLRISNSLTPFFINRMNAMQIALTKQAAMRKPGPKNDEEDEGVFEEAMVGFVASRLKKRLNAQMMAPILVKFGIPASQSGFSTGAEGMSEALAEQLCYETDDEEY